MKDCMYKHVKEPTDELGDDGVKVWMKIFCLLLLLILNVLQQDLIEMTMKKMDQDKDGRVSYSDYIESVKKV